MGNNPFETGLFGGLPKTATSVSATSTADITVPKKASGRAISSSVQERKSSFVRAWETLCSRGDYLDTERTGKSASNAHSSATKARTYRRSLSDRLTPSLISAGLVCGITPSLTRKQLGQPIQVLALSMPAGGATERAQPANSYSSADGRRALQQAEGGAQ